MRQSIKNERVLVTNSLKMAVAVEKVGFQSDYPRSTQKAARYYAQSYWSNSKKRTERPHKKMLRKNTAAQGT